MQAFNSDDNKNHFQGAIFSPYNSKEGTLAVKHGETSQKLSPYTRKDPQKKEEDGEIGVFGAEKYFNEGEEVEATTKYLHHQRDHQISLQTRPYKVQYGTPSVRSESTSNSQSALLSSSSAMRNSPRHNNKKNKAQSKGFLAGIGLKCSCSDKDSVDTSKPAIYDVFHGKTTPKRVFSVGSDSSHSVKTNKPHAEILMNKDVYSSPKPEKHAFSPVNPPSLANHLVKMQLQLEQEPEEPRKSLAVFGSPILSNKGKKNTLSFDKKFTIPSVDFSANSGSNYNDAASDASSDLFEIESIKGKSNNNTFLASEANDYTTASGCASPTNGYAPSEASIEWSVVTASAAVLSDSEEQMSEVTIRSPIRTPSNPSNGKTKEAQRRRPGILLGGCKSHKAVRVAGDAFITYEKPSSNSSPQTRHRNNTSQVARFPAESRIGNFGSRHGQHQNGYATPSPMHRSHPSRGSQLVLYK